MRDEGWEASVKYILKGRHFTHSFSVNVADNRNEVVYFQGTQQLNSDAEIQTVNPCRAFPLTAMSATTRWLLSDDAGRSEVCENSTG